ncbi:dimethyl sulfoxide reductase anchor subunit family protein [Chiayiivirga flava]|uniref:DMSO reductase anchor subunit n=1 Tax=Chiayiivirga flava TaxID=659595 RepID=A0A7W8D8K0_9GAMM|nr:DmsC/YnfH family molybdoenzyme membrane anchor subunit [Chiayiivirga flava]MBB5208755.1 DMSO reductase anchor subunit [Chiayiivirga flava]
MHPALSVILFTTLSGTGYGMLAWFGLRCAWSPLVPDRTLLVMVFGTALALITVGLFASVAHLGKPLRAWRAFSQWRSSWLSREGVLAVLGYAPTLLLFALLWRGGDGAWTRVAGGATALFALATVACTAMIYASLKPVAAWRHRGVVPGYLGFSLLGGAWMLGFLLALRGMVPARDALGASATVLLLGLALLALKLRYWRDTDAAPFASDAERATGLGAFGTVRSFEAPHTETNYLLREMGFVLARKHATRLRTLVLLLAFALPALALALALLWPAASLPALMVAAATFLLGAFVERWLFFAQARHTVALYYRAGES